MDYFTLKYASVKYILMETHCNFSAVPPTLSVFVEPYLNLQDPGVLKPIHIEIPLVTTWR